ncbi:aldose 1-epimerase [Kaistia soli DSM 19436]|uniref:Aldose 1-epimerase n=1 Tax=Kaistia soli DSM 19436 TaxID=1122133 RepID=A0A1M5CB53_9HYPH|nr:aldose 1-epimerase [Kaistia soli]SHF51949.1 aldose 1-epimerase [Kaistia soli DSM 19436]
MIELSDGDLQLGLVPDIGGSLAYFRFRGRDVMRPLSPADAARGDVEGTASFPMLPFANRIADNRFVFDGRTYRVAPNIPAAPLNVHGSGWKSVWTVDRAAASEALLSLDHPADDTDPFCYRATQHAVIEDGSLNLTIGIENRGQQRMPFGFGHHPWFPRDPDTAITFAAREFWLEGPGGIISDQIAIPPQLDFSSGRGLPHGWRNNDYGGWDGRAELRFPSRGHGVRIDADPVFGHLMLYADPKRDVFCLEPQTHVSCAFSRMVGDGADLGVIVLAPGAIASGTLRFSPFPL